MPRPPAGVARLSALAVLAAVLCLVAPAGAVETFDDDASVWDSSVAPSATVLPVGGSGQVNGQFTLDTVTTAGGAIQVGLRAQERFVGATLLHFERVYYAETGESTGGRATWNYDFHMDFGTSFLETDVGMALTPLNLRDYTVTLSLDNDPSPATSFFDQDVNALLDAGAAGPDIRLFQNSWNIDFALLGGPLDPNLPGFYDLALTVESGGSPVAATSILVAAQPPGTTCTDPMFTSVGGPGETGITLTGTPWCVYGLRLTPNGGSPTELIVPVGATGSATDTSLVLPVGGGVVETGPVGFLPVTDTVVIEAINPLVIPTAGELGLLLLGLGLAAAGGLFLRR